MNCEELRAGLDAYMDGELSDEELRAMEAHAATCEDCARELAAARLMHEALSQLPEEADVPLPAQASWRRAVRAEAEGKTAQEAVESGNARKLPQSKPKRPWWRATCAVAAALVLVLGAGTLLGRMHEQDETQSLSAAPETVAAGKDVAARYIAAVPTEAIIARDGAMEESTSESAEDAAAVEEAYTAWKKYASEDVEAAGATIEALVEEYSGTCSEESKGDTSTAGQGSRIYRIELPGEYLADFLTAISHVGTEQDSGLSQDVGDTAIVCIQIDQA